MIEVQALNTAGEVVPMRFDSDAVEVTDGALIIYTIGARDFIGGFAPGYWLTFQRVDGGE